MFVKIQFFAFFGIDIEPKRWHYVNFHYFPLGKGTQNFPGLKMTGNLQFFYNYFYETDFMMVDPSHIFHHMFKWWI